MSWLGRLFGRQEPPPSPPANSVVIADDLAAALTVGDRDLAEAVDVTLREHLDAQARAAAARGERIPFWLQREQAGTTGESSGGGELEEELRDRVIQRRAAEDER